MTNSKNKAILIGVVFALVNIQYYFDEEQKFLGLNISGKSRFIFMVIYNLIMIASFLIYIFKDKIKKLHKKD